MKVIIAGGRDFNNYAKLYCFCKRQLFGIVSDIEIVSGRANGTDRLGEKFARANNYIVKEFPANWDKYGKSAGYIRNLEMAEYADFLIAFWDGKSKGTKYMIDLARKHNLKIKICNY